MSITSLSSFYPFPGLFFIHFLPSTILDAINDIAVNQLTKIDIYNNKMDKTIFPAKSNVKH